MGGIEILLVFLILGGGFYALGWLPTGGIVRLYQRIRLVGLLWALVIVLIAVNRIFNLF